MSSATDNIEALGVQEAALVWLREAARDERQQVAAARRKIGAVLPRSPA